MWVSERVVLVAAAQYSLPSQVPKVPKRHSFVPTGDEKPPVVLYQNGEATPVAVILPPAELPREGLSNQRANGALDTGFKPKPLAKCACHMPGI